MSPTLTKSRNESAADDNVAHVSFPYQPTDRQKEFHDSIDRYRLYGGAMGGGKTHALCAEGILYSLWYPGNRGLIGRQNFTDLRETTYRSFLELCPPELIAQHHRSEHWVRLINGSEIVFRELKNWRGLGSFQLGWVAIDEATEVSLEAFQMLDSRLRHRLPNGERPPYTIFLSSNPGPGWVKRDFADVKRPNHTFVRALPDDNPHLPEGYVQALRDKFPDMWVRRYLEGSWKAVKGLVYPEFEDSVHFIKPYPIPSEATILVSMDYGYVNPTCFLFWFIDYDDVATCFDCHYQSSWRIPQHAARVKEMLGKDGWNIPLSRVSLWLADPSVTARQRDGISVADEYSSNGITLTPANPEMRAGLNRVGSRLKQRPPGLLFFDTARTQIIREEFESYLFQELPAPTLGKRDEPEAPRKLNDHAMDGIKYLINWIEGMGPKRPKADPIPGTPEWRKAHRRNLVKKMKK